MGPKLYASLARLCCRGVRTEAVQDLQTEDESPLKDQPQQDDLATALPTATTCSPSHAFSAPSESSTLQSKLQVPFTDLTFHALIGKGSFKQVYRGKWNNTNVAIVAMRRGGLVTEARLMQQLGAHPNLVQFYRWSTDHRGNEYIVVELVPFGSLDKVLGQFGPSLRNRSKLMMCEQICHAMRELAAEGVLHRDLAARNILVQSMQPVHVKVTDFGLAHQAVDLDAGPVSCGDDMPGDNCCKEPAQQQQRLQGGQAGGSLVPVRWSAPEVLRPGGRWSEKSDVYSYGVTMWEIFSNGAEPYANRSDVEAATAVVRGDVLQRPKDCPHQVYALMRDCWHLDPEQRPSFRQITGLFRRWREMTLAAKTAGGGGGDGTPGGSGGARVPIAASSAAVPHPPASMQQHLRGPAGGGAAGGACIGGGGGGYVEMASLWHTPATLTRVDEATAAAGPLLLAVIPSGEVLQLPGQHEHPQRPTPASFTSRSTGTAAASAMAPQPAATTTPAAAGGFAAGRRGPSRAQPALVVAMDPGVAAADVPPHDSVNSAPYVGSCSPGNKHHHSGLLLLLLDQSCKSPAAAPPAADAAAAAAAAVSMVAGTAATEAAASAAALPTMAEAAPAVLPPSPEPTGSGRLDQGPGRGGTGGAAPSAVPVPLACNAHQPPSAAPASNVLPPPLPPVSPGGAASGPGWHGTTPPGGHPTAEALRGARPLALLEVSNETEAVGPDAGGGSGSGDCDGNGVCGSAVRKVTGGSDVDEWTEAPMRPQQLVQQHQQQHRQQPLEERRSWAPPRRWPWEAGSRAPPRRRNTAGPSPLGPALNLTAAANGEKRHISGPGSRPLQTAATAIAAGGIARAGSQGQGGGDCSPAAAARRLVAAPAAFALPLAAAECPTSAAMVEQRPRPAQRPSGGRSLALRCAEEGQARLLHFAVAGGGETHEVQVAGDSNSNSGGRGGDGSDGGTPIATAAAAMAAAASFRHGCNWASAGSEDPARSTPHTGGRLAAGAESVGGSAAGGCGGPCACCSSGAQLAFHFASLGGGGGGLCGTCMLSMEVETAIEPMLSCTYTAMSLTRGLGRWDAAGGHASGSFAAAQLASPPAAAGLVAVLRGQRRVSGLGRRLGSGNSERGALESLQAAALGAALREAGADPPSCRGLSTPNAPSPSAASVKLREDPPQARPATVTAFVSTGSTGQAATGLSFPPGQRGRVLKQAAEAWVPQPPAAVMPASPTGVEAAPVVAPIVGPVGRWPAAAPAAAGRSPPAPHSPYLSIRMA